MNCYNNLPQSQKRTSHTYLSAHIYIHMWCCKGTECITSQKQASTAKYTLNQIKTDYFYCHLEFETEGSKPRVIEFRFCKSLRAAKTPLSATIDCLIAFQSMLIESIDFLLSGITQKSFRVEIVNIW